jgi:seryl-tRNA synthetase
VDDFREYKGHKQGIWWTLTGIFVDINRVGVAIFKKYLKQGSKVDKNREASSISLVKRYKSRH